MNTEQRDFGAKMFAALGNSTRLHILEYLARQPASVSDIAKAVELKQSMTSQHLANLLIAGIVVYEKIGNTRLYCLRGPRIAQILELVEEFYETHLNSLWDIINRQQENIDDETEIS